MRSKVYFLDEYKYAKQVVEEIPKTLKLLESFAHELESFKHYSYVNELYVSIMENYFYLEMHLETYKIILKEKAEFEGK